MKSSPRVTRLQRSFFARNTLTVARELLGCTLRHDTDEGTAAGLIVETEAYLGKADNASHARFGPTRRSRVLFGKPGLAYVYFIYGMHYMFNVVTETDETAGAVLIRALEPTEGRELMALRRRTSSDRNLTNGPARLCQALAISLEQNEADLSKGPLGIWQTRTFDDAEVVTTARIGVAGSKEKPYRYLVRENRHVSGQRSGRDCT